MSFIICLLDFNCFTSISWSFEEFFYMKNAFVEIIVQLKTAINRASSRNDIATIRDALEVSAEMYRKDSNNVPDYVQRHLLSLSIWDELRYVFYEALLEILG